VTSGVTFLKMADPVQCRVFLRNLELYDVASGKVVGEVVPGMELPPGTAVRIKQTFKDQVAENAQNSMKG
jgi:hypothetical protein